MDSKMIWALRDLGIDVTDVQYKYPAEDAFSMSDPQTKFVLKGSFYDESDPKQLMDEMLLLRAIKKNPVAKDLYEKLRTVAGLTDG